MTMDPNTPPSYVTYTAVGGPLDGKTISVPEFTTLFYYRPNRPLRGQRVVMKREHYRVEDGQLVWVEGKA